MIRHLAGRLGQAARRYIRRADHRLLHHAALRRSYPAAGPGRRDRRADRCVAPRARLRPPTRWCNMARISPTSPGSISARAWFSALASPASWPSAFPTPWYLRSVRCWSLSASAFLPAWSWRSGAAACGTRAGRLCARRPEPADVLVRHSADPAVRRRAGLAAHLGCRLICNP